MKPQAAKAWPTRLLRKRRQRSPLLPPPVPLPPQETLCLTCTRASGRALPVPALKSRANRWLTRGNRHLCRILSTKLDTLLKVMRVINILNGIGLAFSCYFAFTVIGGSVTRFFLAVYIG